MNEQQLQEAEKFSVPELAKYAQVSQGRQPNSLQPKLPELLLTLNLNLLIGNGLRVIVRVRLRTIKCAI